MSGPIQFEMSKSVWNNNNLSCLSHNSSSSKLGTKDKWKAKAPTSNTRPNEKFERDANREIMKKITSDNKYFAILKKITQDTGRHYGTSNNHSSKHHKSGERAVKRYEMVDSSGGTGELNLTGTVTTRKSQRRMHGTEKFDMKKYKSVIKSTAINIGIDKNGCVQDEEKRNAKFPLQPEKALKLFQNKLTAYEHEEILDYKHIYFIGSESDKIEASPEKEYNYGYDDERGDYNVTIGDHISYRFEVIDFLGKGSFGQAIKCFDHKRKTFIALKIIRNKKKFQYQASIEVKILRHLRENDPRDENSIIRLKDSFVFREHICITFELLSINLYEFIKSSDFEGVSLGLIRRFAIQILQGLRYIRQQGVIHCDLKPENILLKRIDKSGIKIIDFGSGCFDDEQVYTYIQSRFYRAPEIILGIPYTTAIDMWSCGCILAELYSGFPIFAGESEMDQLGLILEICGIPEDDVLEVSTRKNLFFDENNQPVLKPNSRGKLRKPCTKTIKSVLKCNDPSFIDFLKRCFEWDPEKRMTPDEALFHKFILEGLPPKILEQHMKILGMRDAFDSHTQNQITNDDSLSNTNQLNTTEGAKLRKSSINSQTSQQFCSPTNGNSNIPKDLNLANTAKVKGVSSFFKDTGKSKLFSP